LSYHERINTLAPSETGYIAGIIDGEGTITIELRKRKTKCGRTTAELSPSLGIHNTDRRLLEYLFAFLGKEKIHMHTYVRKNRKHKTAYVFHSNSPEWIRVLLEKVRPFLIIKSEQADLLLQFIDEKTNRRKLLVVIQKRERGKRPKIIDTLGSKIPEKDMNFYRRMKELNVKGPR
jgi:hypothetical protein